MAHHTHNFFEGERDIPINLSSGHEEGTQFARFYLERANQNSNIYFVEHQEESDVRPHAPHTEKKIKPRVSPMSVIWRFAWLCAGGAAIALALFVIPDVVPAGRYARNDTDHAAAYTKVLVAQQAALKGEISESIAAFRSAREQSVSRQSAPSGVAAVIGAARDFLWRTTTPASTLDAVLADVVDRSAASVAPLADLSFTSLFYTKNGASAGDIVERAFGEAKNAEAAIENAQDALIVAEEYGDAEALRATLGPQLSLMKANLERYAADLALASWALGVEYPRRFLFVAQDPSIARATGGVIRSLGVVTMEKGAITDVRFDEVYSIDGQLQTNVIPPMPIQKTATAWSIHDANWFFDFPLSARKIAYFYEQAGGKRIDGVVAVNDHVLKKILSITGPVSGKNDEPVNAQSGTVAGDPAALAAIAHVLGTLSGEKASNARAVIMDGLKTKDVLVWASDRDREEAIRAKGWSGAMAAPAGADYFAIAASDIDGTGDAGITGEILKETTVGDHGEVINTVVVEFAGTESVAREKLRYLRVYVPLGSELLEASSGAVEHIIPQIDYAKERFVTDADVAASERTLRRDEASNTDVFEESGRTVFGMWMPVGNKGARAVFRYTIPVVPSDIGAVSSVFQRQPGLNMGLHFSVIVPDGKTLLFSDGLTGEFHGPLESDTSFSMIIQ